MDTFVLISLCLVSRTMITSLQIKLGFITLNKKLPLVSSAANRKGAWREPELGFSQQSLMTIQPVRLTYFGAE